MAYEKYQNLRYITSFSIINYIQAGATFLLTLLLARFVSVSVFGDYRFGMVVLSIVSVTGLYGAEKGLLIDLIHRKKEAVTLAAYYLIRTFVAACAAGAVVFYAVSTKNHYQAVIACIFAVAAIPMALRSAGWFEYRERLRQHAFIIMLDKAMLLLVVGVILACGDWHLNASMLGVLTLGTVAATFALELGVVFPRVDWSGVSIRPVAIELRSMLCRYGWVWLLALSNMLMTSIGQLVLYSRGGKSELAYFALALQFASVSRLFMRQVTQLQGASIAVKTGQTTNRRDLARHLIRAVRTVGIGGGGLSLVTASAAAIIIYSFFAEKYLPALTAVWILHAWVIVLGIGLNVNRYVIGLGLQKIAFFTSLFWAVICICATYMLAPQYGATGYACALFLCHAGSVISQCVILFTTKG